MLRALIFLILVGGLALLAMPFIVASLYVDQRGIAVPGRVYAKHETVSIQYSGWKLLREVTIEYSPPDDATVAFLGVHLLPEPYDALHVGQPVSLRYLRRKDIPDLPMAKFLREVHALPAARMAGQSTFSGLQAFFDRKTVIVCCSIGGILVVLFAWRRSRLPGFPWAVGACVFLGATVLLIQDFPTPAGRPVSGLRRAAGRVQSVGRIDKLFEGSHQRGVEAAQPVEVVAVEFVPAGRPEPVVAVDLIDAGSISGLREGSAVAVEYEEQSPRTAYIQNATRNFVSRNLKGTALEGVFVLLTMAVFFCGAHYLRRAWNRLTRR